MKKSRAKLSAMFLALAVGLAAIAGQAIADDDDDDNKRRGGYSQNGQERGYNDDENRRKYNLPQNNLNGHVRAQPNRDEYLRQVKKQ